MLENLARKKTLATSPAPGCRSCPSLRRASQRASFEFARGTTRSFFPAIERIAKHSRDRFVAAQIVHLKTVRLFVRAFFSVDAADVLFRIRIRSPSHVALPNKYFKQRRNQRVAVFLSSTCVLSGAG